MAASAQLPLMVMNDATAEICPSHPEASRLFRSAVSLPAASVIASAIAPWIVLGLKNRVQDEGWAKSVLIVPTSIGGAGFAWLALGADWRAVEDSGDCEQGLLRVSRHRPRPP